MQPALRVRVLAPVALALLAYAACGPGLPSTVPLGGTVPASEVAVTERKAGAAGAPSEPLAQGELPAPVNGQDSSELTPAPESQQPPKPEASAPSSAAAAPTSDKAPEAACDDSGGSAPDCKGLETGACGAAFGSVCRVLSDALKPKLSNIAVTCLAEKNRASECSALDECIDLGLEKACVVASASALCSDLLKRCPEPKTKDRWRDQRRCERGVSALKDTLAKEVEKCLADSCDIKTCLLESKPD